MKKSQILRLWATWPWLQLLEQLLAEIARYRHFLACLALFGLLAAWRLAPQHPLIWIGMAISAGVLISAWHFCLGAPRRHAVFRLFCFCSLLILFLLRAYSSLTLSEQQRELAAGEPIFSKEQKQASFEILEEIGEARYRARWQSPHSGRTYTVLLQKESFQPSSGDAGEVKQHKHFFYGEGVWARGVFRCFEPARNPGAWDEKRWAKEQNLDLLFTYRRVDRQGETSRSWLGILNRFRQRNRMHIRQRLQQLFPEREAGLAAAFILGDQSLLTSETKGQFKDLDITHMLVISGSHFAAASTVIGMSLRLIGFRLQWRRWLTLGTLLLYTFLIGAQASVMRASLMAVLAILASISRRFSNPLDRLYRATMMMAIISPSMLLKAAFQCSFWAVWSIMTFSPKIEALPSTLVEGVRSGLARHFRYLLPRQSDFFPHHERLRLMFFYILRLMWRALTVSLSAQIGLAIQFCCNPLLKDLAHAYSIFSGLINLSVMLVVSLICCLLLSLLPLLFLAHAILMPWIFLLRVLFVLLTSLIDFWARMPLISCSSFIAALLGLLLWGLADRGQRKLVKAGFYLWLCVNIAFSALLFKASQAFLAAPIQVICLDIGQGDATLLRLAAGYTILVDTGTAKNCERVIPKALKNLGVPKIDLLVLTHWDTDHCGGAAHLLQNGWIKAVLWPEADGEPRYEQQAYLKEVAAKVGAETFHWPKQGLQKRGVRIQSIWPPEHYEQKKKGRNENSRVLKFSTEYFDWVILADVGRDEEEAIIKQGLLRQYSFIRTGHHGSVRSSHPQFAAVLKSPLAIFSVGKNRYGHPHPEALDAWTQSGAKVLRTDQSGAICLEFWHNKVKVKTWMQ